MTLRALVSQPLKVTLKASHRLAAPLPVIPDADPMLGGGTVEVTNPLRLRRTRLQARA